jgi:predicted nucleic acid-binding protein
MKYLLDTCAISEIIRPTPNPAFITWIDAQDENDMFLSLFTLGELYKGAFKVKDKNRQTKLLEWIEHDLKIRFHRRILTIDEDVIYLWGKSNGENEQLGKKLPIADSLIASIATLHNLTVVTRNIRDFEMCSTPVFNPWK